MVWKTTSAAVHNPDDPDNPDNPNNPDDPDNPHNPDDPVHNPEKATLERCG